MYHTLDYQLASIYTSFVVNSFRNVVSRQCKQKPLYTKTRDLYLFYVYFKSFIYYNSKYTTYIKHQDHIAHLTPVCPALIYSSVVVVVISYSVFWKKELFPGDKINCSEPPFGLSQLNNIFFMCLAWKTNNIHYVMQTCGWYHIITTSLLVRIDLLITY